MNNITLLIMAAGMGSRYGGLKQLDAIGPSGETIIDYSVFIIYYYQLVLKLLAIKRDPTKQPYNMGVDPHWVPNY